MPLAAAPWRLYARVVSVEGEKFDSLLDQIRELHRLADELTYAKPRLHDNIRARLGRIPDRPPALPPEQQELADQAIDLLTTPRLSSSQARKLERAFFER